MTNDRSLFEADVDHDVRDPDETPIRDRKVVTQPYDIAIETLVDQVKGGTVFLRPLNERPRFQRRYVWSDILASRLVESVLLNVPIPPCYLSQNEDFELDVIDGQQRIFSLFRFTENQFALSGLEVLTDLNHLRCFELAARIQRKLKTFSLRCILITNESHPEIKFDIFERLNSNTVPLNAQELRNCIYRGPLNELIGELALDSNWLSILGRKQPDKRLRDEELILRFFAFKFLTIESYKTPLKHWLNDAAKAGRHMSPEDIESLRRSWNTAISNSITWFGVDGAFRRPGAKALNRALFDLIMSTAYKIDRSEAAAKKTRMARLFNSLLSVEEFNDLVGRSVDHKKRTERRFDMWLERVEIPLLHS